MPIFTHLASLAPSGQLSTITGKTRAWPWRFYFWLLTSSGCMLNERLTIHQKIRNPTLNLFLRVSYWCDQIRTVPTQPMWASRCGPTWGKVEQVEQNNDGDITAVMLSDGTKIEGDLFIDCSGFRSLLLNQQLNVDFEDWSEWLMRPSRCHSLRKHIIPLPYTKAIAHEAGWQWKIPLQHRMGNSHVYSSAHMSDDRDNDIAG